jgi:hypothetical protein
VPDLQPVEPLPSQVVLLQGSPEPVIVGEHAAGADYWCAWCRRRLLIKKGLLNGLWDLVIECGACHRRSATPELPPGMPLGRPLGVLPVGTYRIDGSITQRPDVVLAGKPALERRQLEIGEQIPESVDEVSLDEDICRQVLTEVENLIPELLDRIRPTYERALASPTPPRTTHRLLRLMDRVEASAESLRDDDVSRLDHLALHELRAAVQLLKRWQKDPAWPDLVASMKEPTNYEHTMVTLAMASMLTDTGNGVGLQRPTRGRQQRSADLKVVLGAIGQFDIEVKAPALLQDPTGPISARQGKKLVHKLLDSAAGGRRRQVGSVHPGMLAIGGFNLREGDLDVLERAANGAFASTRASRAQIAGIALVGFGLHVEAFDHGPSGILVPSQFEWAQGAIRTRLIHNPRYTGSVSIRYAPPDVHWRFRP